MKKSISIISIFFVLVLLTGCQDEYSDEPKYFNSYFPEDTVVDDTGIADDYDWFALSKNTVSLDDRIYGGAFTITPSYFRAEYNQLVDEKYQITDFERSITTEGGYDYIRFKIDDDLCIYMDVTSDYVFNVYFAYPVTETQNGALDYEQPINAMFSLIDSDMEQKVTLEELASNIDVTNTNGEQLYQPYAILRKYLVLSCFAQEGVGYIGIGGNFNNVPQNIDQYFIEE